MKRNIGNIGKFADPPDLYQFNDMPPLPPVYQDPPKYPDPIDNGGIINPPFRGYFYSGVVRDAYTEQPLPGATVSLLIGRNAVATQAADRNGNFQFDINEPVEAISISEVSHKPFTWPASEVQHTFDLEPDRVILPPVILPPGTKGNDTWLWLVGLLAVAKWQKWI